MINFNRALNDNAWLVPYHYSEIDPMLLNNLVYDVSLRDSSYLIIALGSINQFNVCSLVLAITNSGLHLAKTFFNYIELNFTL